MIGGWKGEQESKSEQKAWKRKTIKEEQGLILQNLTVLCYQ